MIPLPPSLRALCYLFCICMPAVANTTAHHPPPSDAVQPSRHYAVALAPQRTAFTAFSLDSLGQGRLKDNPVLSEPDAQACPGLVLRDGTTYEIGGRPVWHLERADKSFVLRTTWSAPVSSSSASVAAAVPAGVPPTSAASPDIPSLALSFDQKANHATLLGRMEVGERRMSLPCLLHLPDLGTLRITASVPGLKLDYDARRHVARPFVSFAFPAASAKYPIIEYTCEVVAVHPRLAGREQDARLDGFRRNFLSVFQVNPRAQMLANNAASDPVAFSIFTYAEMARPLPPLAEGLTALDLVRMTLDRYLAGAKGYGQPGYGVDPKLDLDLAGWKTPYTSLDTLPSFLIAACLYVDGSGDLAWARQHFPRLVGWGGEMFASDWNGNGLIEYPTSGNYNDRPARTRRPANWWDTINFGHEDAYSNALAYRAACLLAELADRLARPDVAQHFSGKAERLRAAYVPTFLNPATGVLAGWRSRDGQLHDYWFTFVQGVAISAGLLDDTTANSVMDRLLAKMREVGYTRFEHGLPGNLVPIRKGDYVHNNTPPQRFGEPQLEDGTDGFQFYENGGATGCWTYYTLKALYRLGRVEEARALLHPMLRSYASGEFQGFGPNGMSRDWRDWQGGCHGYEGLLVENYHALLAVLDDDLSHR